MIKYKKTVLYQKIEKHGQNLKAMFKLGRDIDPVKLCKRLVKLENKAHKVAVECCNGDIDQLEWDKKADQILTKVETILKNKKVLFLKLGVSLFSFCLALIHNGFLRKKSVQDRTTRFTSRSQLIVLTQHY